MARKPFRPRPAEEGCTLLLAPDCITSAAVGSIEYQVGPDGAIEVPSQFATELEAHGFVRAPLPAPKSS